MRVVAEKVVGIDLGTTNSAVAAMEGSRPTIVTNAEGQRTTPSVVAYTKAGDRLVGQVAKRQAVVNPENTFFSVKRFIGRKMDEVADESKQVSYNVTRDSNGNVKLECPATGKQFAAEEISAQVLQGAAVLPGHPRHVAQSWRGPQMKGCPHVRVMEFTSGQVGVGPAFFCPAGHVLLLPDVLLLLVLTPSVPSGPLPCIFRCAGSEETGGRCLQVLKRKDHKGCRHSARYALVSWRGPGVPMLRSPLHFRVW